MISKLIEIKSQINVRIYYILLVGIKSLGFLIPKKKNKILLGAWFGNKYIDNTMYVYEYLLNDSKYDVCWYTKNKEIFNSLVQTGKPVVLANTIKSIWTQLRSKLFLSTVQMSEFNPMFVTNCKYLDLGHGHPIKDCGDITWNKSVQTMFRMRQLFVDYYVAYPGKIHGDVSIKSHNTKSTNIRFSNFARNDFFFDKSLQTDSLFPIPYSYKGKTIVYMPTHRSEGQVQINIQSIFDLETINKICEDSDSIFIIKKHYYHRNETTDLSSYSRIFDFTNEPIDPQFFLLHADILITDYSACYIDYLLLDRPIIFYQYDYDSFQKNERSFIIPFCDINIGPKPQTIIDFNNALVQEIKDQKNSYHQKREDFMVNYYSKPHPHHGREDVKLVIDELLGL